MGRSLSLLRCSLDKITTGLSAAATVQRLTRPVVAKACDRIEDLLVVDGRVPALERHLAQQPVGVFAGTPLPNSVQVTEVNTHVSLPRQVSVRSHFLALVIGQLLPERCRDLVEVETELRQRGFNCLVRHLDQQHQARRVLDKHANDGFVARTLDQVALPATRHDSIVGLRNLLWRSQPSQHMQNKRPGLRTRIKLASTARLRETRLATGLSGATNAEIANRIALQLPAQRTGTATQGGPNGQQAHPQHPHRRQHNATFHLH